MKRISFLAAALAATRIVGCRRDDAIAPPGTTNIEQVGTTTTTGAELPATTASPAATAAPSVPATRSLEGVGGGMAPGMPASFPQSSSLTPERSATAPSAPAGTSATAPASGLDSTVEPPAVFNRPATEPRPSQPLVAPGLESTSQYGYQGPTGGPMRPGAASNPDTTSGAR